MADKIEPALTPEEWERGACERVHDRVYGRDLKTWVERGGEDTIVLRIQEESGYEEYAEIAPAVFPQVAALCLHGQPFGFTHLSAYAIRELAKHARETAAKVGPLHALWDSIFEAEAAADKIAALLPPE